MEGKANVPHRISAQSWEFDSDIWWNAPPANRDGIIRGFLAKTEYDKLSRVILRAEKLLQSK